MANPLQALGNILQGKQPDATACKDIFEGVQKDDAHAVEHFLSRGVRINDLNGDGWTAVQMACWYDSMKALGALLKWNPDLRVKDAAGRTAVHLAAFNGSERCLRRVLHAGAEVDARDKHGLTALHKASVAGQLSSIRTLLEYKADASLATADGLTAAHLAAWKGQREALRLLASGHANIQTASNDGGTPLHEAVRSDHEACVQLLLQMGANPAAADRFGRTPGDLAFAAGNRAVFALLHEATQKAAAAASAPEDTPDIPDPSEFWQYLQQQKMAPAATAGAAQAPLTPTGQQAPRTQDPHPRKQFEAWLGGILFPQRQRTSTPAAASGTPYGTVNASAKPPPSLAQPAFKQMMKTGPPTHGVGHVGGSQFSARKAAQAHTGPSAPPPAAAAQSQADAPVQNIQLTLDPYEDEGPPQAVGAGDVAGEAVPENPLAAMMQAIGKKAQKDIKTTMDGVASMVSTIPPPNTKQQQAGGTRVGGKVATMGDDEAYDSDEYDGAILDKAEEGNHEDGEDWGECADEQDDWGTTGASALKAKKRAQRAAAAEGRIYTMQEAREKLDQLDAATAAAQGWLRGRTTKQRLAALNTFASAYPKVPQPATSTTDEAHRVKAANPFAILTQGLWQAKPHEQEDERVAVQAHLQTATAAAAVAAQAAGDTPSPVPLINFRDAWTATDRFSSSSLLLEDVFGKVFRADILGGTHALRVLDSSLYDPAGLSQYLDAAAQIDHAHIVRVKGAAPDRGMLVLDLPESGNLLYVLQTAVLPTTEPLGWNGCVDITLAVASALQHLHNRPVPMAHGRLNSATVYFDRNAVAKVGDAGLEALCGTESLAAGKLMARDLHSLGEIMMQLLTLNTQPIDDGMRKSILDFADAGKHIMPSSKLSWPKTTAETFEAVAIACMRAGDAEDTAKALNEGIVPALQSMRGETLQSMWKHSGASAKQRADGSFIVPSAYRCPLTGEMMLDPVRAADGFVYERSAIEQWLTLGRKRSPMTNMPLTHPYVTPDRDLRAAVQNWLQSQNGASAPVAA